jgi:hypothetical protein
MSLGSSNSPEGRYYGRTSAIFFACIGDQTLGLHSGGQQVIADSALREIEIGKLPN